MEIEADKVSSKIGKIFKMLVPEVVLDLYATHMNVYNPVFWMVSICKYFCLRPYLSGVWYII